MTGHVTRKSACRLCGSRALELVLPIRPSPIGDAFITAQVFLRLMRLSARYDRATLAQLTEPFAVEESQT